MNYVGKPLALMLATAERPDDADNTLRIAFGNEATDRDIDEFARRFGCRVVDSFGSSEFAVIVTREDGTPTGSIGKGYPGVAVYHSESVTECAPAVFDENGALANFDEAVGELVNTEGGGPFAGYYNDPAATGERIATACTGRVIWRIGTPTAGSTWPVAPRIGCGSTARTSRPHPSSEFCSG